MLSERKIRRANKFIEVTGRFASVVIIGTFAIGTCCVIGHYPGLLIVIGLVVFANVLKSLFN